MAEKDSTLNQAYYQNVRDAQIGGETDGMPPEVAHDLGYTDPADGPHILDLAETTRRMGLTEDIIDESATTIGGAALSTETTRPRKGTSAEQNANESRHITAHSARALKQILPGQHF